MVETFRKISARISRLIEEQKDLSNAISHELRTPLARLKFSLALIDQNDVADLDSMRNDINELENLIDEMLSYSRLESVTDELNLAPVSINQLLENLLERLRVNSSKQLKLEIQKQILWLCDGHYLERAIQNLLTNAIYYARKIVVVSVAIVKNDLVIIVEDDGIGIKAQDQKNTFKPFVRLDKSRVKKNGGFGLGLAIVKRIIDKHLGNCEISSSSLGGAKFTVTLPLAKNNNQHNQK